ncbi:MAG: hypothetical protein P8J68_07155 [Arenicellaceae bacterium]|nr:hypothetical protein [Arenicellaceae bacterium]
MFENLSILPEGPIGVIMEQYRQDQNINKVDLGVGVYRDENGKSLSMKAVYLAEQKGAKRKYKPLKPSSN